MMNEIDHAVSEKKRYLTFKLEREEYAIDIFQVREIRRFEHSTPLPMSEPYIAGVINMRGAIIPILNLRARFGLEVIPAARDTAIIMVAINSGGRSRIIGIIVDQVSDIYTIANNQIESTPDLKKDKDNDCIKGITTVDDKLIILLHQDKLINLEDE